MYSFGRPVLEEEIPIAPRYRHFYEPMFSTWTTKVKVAFVVVITVIIAVFMGLFVYLEHEYPLQKFLPTTVAPSEHLLYTLAPHKERHRQTYAKNVFVEMLHQTHSVANTTDCWECGLLPSVVHNHDLFLSLPMTYLGSCEAWFRLFSAIYRHWGEQRKTLDYNEHNLVLEYIDAHYGFNKSGRGGRGYIDPQACMQKYLAVRDEAWMEEELYDFRNFNASQYFQLFLERNVTRDRTVPIPILNVSSLFCVQGIGRVQVGESICNYTHRLRKRICPPLVTPPNVYFVCGENAYTWLPRNWAGRCYMSFLYPPVYIAPSDYHRTHRLRSMAQTPSIVPQRHRRQLIKTEVDQTDTSLQQFTDFSKGLVSFWGPIFNSREIRRLPRIVENVINITTDIMTNLTAELQATRLVALQNRMVLDVILADRGGACRVVGSSCCMYIPDSAPSVHLAIQKLHRIASDMHVDNGSWSLSGWFWGLLTTWGWKILLILGGAAGIIFTCCVLLQCGPACCSYCASRIATMCIPTKVPSKAQMLQQEINELMTINEDIFED